MLNILSICDNVQAAQWLSDTHTVAKVIDGDTLMLDDSTIIRLYGIDCPEGRQEAGDEATTVAAHLTQGQSFAVEAHGRDRYGRTVAILFLSDGSSLQEGLIRAGAAWVYPRYCKLPVCREWKIQEEAARMEQRGSWRYPHPIPPWEWRKGHR